MSSNNIYQLNMGCSTISYENGAASAKSIGHEFCSVAYAKVTKNRGFREGGYLKAEGEGD